MVQKRKRSLKGSTKNDYIPKNYDDLYRYYVLGDGNGNSLTHQLIRKIVPHADNDEREVLAQETFLRIIKTDMLNRYDPTKANFGGVIFFVCRSICVNHLSKKSRNPLTGLNGGSLSMVDAEDETFEPGVYSLDRLFGTEAPDHEGDMTNSLLIKELKEWAQRLAATPRHKRDQSLILLINLIYEQHETKDCGKILGVTPSTVSNWMEVLRKKTHELSESLHLT